MEFSTGQGGGSRKSRHHRVPLHGVAGTCARVDVENGAVVQVHRDEALEVYGDSLEVGLTEADPQNGNNYEGTEGQDEQGGSDGIGVQQKHIIDR